MKVAVSNIAWSGSDDAEVAERLVAAGVTGVEIAPTKVWPDLTLASPLEAKRYGERWADAGLPVIAAQSLLFGRPDLHLLGESRYQLVEYLSMVIDVCAAMGAAALVFGSPRNRLRGELPIALAHERAVQVFTKLAARADAEGTCICLEANPAEYGADFLTTAAEAAALVRDVDSPGLRVHLDSACMALAGDDPRLCVNSFIDLLMHVHVSEPFLAPVGMPNPTHQEMSRALRSSSYRCYVSVEMRPAPDGTEVAAVEAAARYTVEVFGTGT